MEIVFELLFEFLLQILFELAAELGLHSIDESRRRRPNPWLAAIGYSLIGGICGAISLAIFPDLFVTSESGRILNLIFSPILAGLLMMAMGAWRLSRGDDLVRIDKFAYGYLFALNIALVRFYFGG